MATNADFDALIVRIDTATNTLETSVQAVADGSADVEAAVIEAQQAATTATQQATQASNSATVASNSATTATQQAQAATNLVAQLEASVVLEEAPEDGQQYARKDGEWTVVEAAGGGGEGTVTSVNNIAPDEEGNITLSASDVGAKPSSYIPTWAEVTGKPTVYPTNWANVADKPATFAPSAHTHAAEDVTSGTFDAARIPNLPASKITTGVLHPARVGSGTTGATKVLYGDGTWKDVPGGNTDVGVTFTYDGVSRTTWPVADRFEAINLALVTVNGVTGADLFAGTGTVNTLPLGKYYFSGVFTSGSLQAKIGVISVERATATQKRAWAFVQAGSGDTEGKMFIHKGSDGSWLPVM